MMLQRVIRRCLLRRKRIGRSKGGDVGNPQRSSCTQQLSAMIRRDFSAHPHRITDPYQYLREPSEKIWKMVEQENSRTLHYVGSKLRGDVESDIQILMAQVKEPCAERGPSGKYLYSTSSGIDGRLRYSRTCASVCNQKVEEILNVNLNEYELKAMSLSVDETLLAYITSSVATPGETKLWIKDLMKDTVRDLSTKGSTLAFVEWGPLQEDGNHSLFYTSTDSWNRPDSVWAFNVCKDHSTLPRPIQIYHNSDDMVIVDVQRTKGCQYVAISAATKTTNEIYLVSDIGKPPLLVRRRQLGLHYHLDVGANNEIFLLASAQGNENGLDEQLTLFQTTVENLPLESIGSFGTFLAGKSKEFVIADMDIFREYLVLYERSSTNGSQRVRIKSRNDNQDTVIDVAHQMYPCGNMAYDAPSVQFTVESPVLAPLTYEYTFSDRRITSSHHDSSTCMRSSLEHNLDEKHAHVRVLVESHDGVQIPLTLFHRRDEDPFQRDNPVVLVGYGAYGEPVMQGYDPTSAAPLIDRGVVVAFAHTRGGGDLGRGWYHGGRLHNKINAIEDYRACAQSLVDSIVDPTRLTAKAFSAGGVTVGAAVNRSPELFGSVVLINAFLDVTTSMSIKMALTEHEYEEWGNPTVDPKVADLIASYCPMANLKKSETYPRTLIVGTLDDTNVPYWHALSFYAKLADPSRHLMYMVPQGGHHMHGSSLEVAALTNSFILQSSASE